MSVFTVRPQGRLPGAVESLFPFIPFLRGAVDEDALRQLAKEEEERRRKGEVTTVGPGGLTFEQYMARHEVPEAEARTPAERAIEAPGRAAEEVGREFSRGLDLTTEAVKAGLGLVGRQFDPYVEARDKADEERTRAATAEVAKRRSDSAAQSGEQPRSSTSAAGVSPPAAAATAKLPPGYAYEPRGISREGVPGGFRWVEGAKPREDLGRGTYTYMGDQPVRAPEAVPYAPYVPTMAYELGGRTLGQYMAEQAPAQVAATAAAREAREARGPTAGELGAAELGLRAEEIDLRRLDAVAALHAAQAKAGLSAAEFEEKRNALTSASAYVSEEMGALDQKDRDLDDAVKAGKVNEQEARARRAAIEKDRKELALMMLEIQTGRPFATSRKDDPYAAAVAAMAAGGQGAK